EPLLAYSGELSFRFLALWPIVAIRRTQPPEIWMPFYHLKTSGVWLPLDSVGNETGERRKVAFARIDPDFFACLQDADFRQQLRVLLIDRYFADPMERAALAEFAGVDLDKVETQILNDQVLQYEMAHRLVREAKFRLTIVPAY